MNRFLMAALVIGSVTFVTVFSVRFLQNRSRVQLTVPPPSDDKGEARRSLKDLLSEPVFPNRFSFGATPSPLCQEFWRQSTQSRLPTWMSEVDEMGWQRPDECGDEEPPILSRLARGVQVACLKRHSDRRAFEQKACQAALFNYRLKLIDALSMEQKNYLDMPLVLLLSKILADHLALEESEKSPLPDFWARIDALLAREPDWFPAQKLVVISLYYRQRAVDDPDLKAQLGERLTVELDKATQMESQDPQILEIELLRQVDLGEEGSAEIEKFAMKHADFALGQYHWAAVLCRENNRPDCLSVLEKAVSLRPNEVRFQDTLARVRATERVGDPALFSLQPDFDVLSW